MRRSGKILCGFGALELFCAVVALFIFEHVPFPCGGGTLAIGLSDDDWFDRAMTWEFHVLAGIFGAGLIGTLFLFVGLLLYVMSKFRPRV